MNAVVTPKESGVEGVNYATFRLDNVGGAHVYGQMAWPKRAGKFPALVIFQWARPPYPLAETVGHRPRRGGMVRGQRRTARRAERHAASVLRCAAADAQGVSADQRRPTATTTISSRCTSGTIGPWNFIAARPEWDGRTLVATGISMGGQQSLVTAALNPKITGVVVNVPAGADAAAALHGATPGTRSGTRPIRASSRRRRTSTS